MKISPFPFATLHITCVAARRHTPFILPYFRRYFPGLWRQEGISGIAWMMLAVHKRGKLGKKWGNGYPLAGWEAARRLLTDPASLIWRRTGIFYSIRTLDPLLDQNLGDEPVKSANNVSCVREKLKRGKNRKIAERQSVTLVVWIRRVLVHVIVCPNHDQLVTFVCCLPSIHYASSQRRGDSA